MQPLGWAPAQYDWCPHKQGGLDAETGMDQGRWKKDTQGEDSRVTGGCNSKLSTARTVSRLLGEAKEVLLQSGGGTWPSWDLHCAVKCSSTEPYPSWHLHFGLPAFRTARPYIYGVLSCPAVGIILFYFINLFLAALVLGCHSQGFSSGGEWGLLSSCSGRAFHWSDFSCCTAWA